MISAIVLTYNSERSIGQTLSSAFQVSDDVHVVDSYSEDTTEEIVRRSGARFVQHEFGNYGLQRNWAMENLPVLHPWQLHLDADEFLSQGLVDEINGLKSSFPDGVDGYHIARLVRFLGRDLRHGGLYPIWHMRLFKSGVGMCETREYDQHFIVNGRTARLRNPMIDDHRMSITEWVTRHNRWASAEVRQLIRNNQNQLIAASVTGSPIERKRYFRRLYLKMPLFIRPTFFFLYRYFLQFGFLDGKEGLIYLVLQSFWFRFLIDAKLFEYQRMAPQRREIV